MTEEIDLDWFESFYGKPFDPNIGIFLSLTNDSNHYAFDEGILMGASCDNNGNPFFNTYNYFVLLHEINHHYTYPLFEDNWESMESAAERFPIPVEVANLLKWGSFLLNLLPL